MIPPDASVAFKDMNFLPAASLRIHLLAFVAAVALPLGLLVAYHVDRLNEDALAVVGDEAQDAAEFVATDLDRFLERTGRWMERLAHRPELAALDPRRCGSALADFLDVHRRYAAAATVDAQGQVVCFAAADGTEMKAGVSAADRDWFRRSLQDDRLQIDGPLTGRVTGKRVVALSLPVRGPDGRRGVIALGLDLAEIQAGLERFGFPAETLVTVTDDAGRVLARTRDAEAWFGRPDDAPSARAYTTRASEKILLGVGADGVERAHAAAAVPIVGWEVKADISVAPVLAANRQARILNYAGIAALALGLMTLVFWLRRRILAPVEALAAAARAVAAGDAAVRVAEPLLDEMRDVSRQFNTMLEVRQTSERRLRESEEKYRTLVQQLPAITYVVEMGMAGTGLDLTVSFVSPQIASLGFAPEEWLADPGLWARQLHPEDRERVLAVYERGLAAGGLVECDYRLLDKAGRARWFHDVASVVLGEDGRRRLLEGVMQDITERKQAEAELEASRRQLRALAQRLEAAREAERTRIAREVHDEFGQALTGLKLDLALLAQQLPGAAPAVAQQIEDMNRLIDTTVQSVRRISYELRPGVLDTLGLTAAAEWLCREFQARSGIACRADLQENLAADAARATALFRILQELLTNVARHARASSVVVRLKEREGRLRLTVADDGVGLGLDAVSWAERDALGLLGVRERAEQFGGCVEIDSAPERGTRIAVDIPAKEDAQ